MAGAAPTVAPAGTIPMVPATARLHIRALDVDLNVAAAVRRLARRDRVTAWSGMWSRGCVLTCDPVHVVRLDPQQAFGLLASQPVVAPDPEHPDAVGGGWFGWLGYPGTRDGDAPSSAASWGWYRDVLRFDGRRWWYEALLSDGALLSEGQAMGFDAEAAAGRCAALVAELATARPLEAAHLSLAATPDAERHLGAVERCQQAIRCGDIYQANIATRIDVQLDGSPVDAWARLVEELDPARAGLVIDADGSVVSASPELFLSRTGRTVRTDPIKGTRPRLGDADDGRERERLRSSEKDAAENVMIVDLMRNDLARVCVPGSVSVPALLEVQPHPGVWHLVSSVSGRLADGNGDAELLASAFPPGSVTGTPKLRAMEVIAELESGSRGVFTGALGYASPLAGLELAVAIRTLEVSAHGAARLWVGGGITVDSTPALEWQECLDKAAPLLRVLGAGPWRTAVRHDPPPPALFETVLVVDGEPQRLAAHVGRLRRSYWECFGVPLTADVAGAVRRAIGPGGRHQRIRIDVGPLHPGRAVATARDCPAPVPLAQQHGVVLVARTATAGYCHKSVDRRWLEVAEAGLLEGECALLVGPEGQVRQTTRSNVLVVSGGVVRTSALDGEVLPGTTRQEVLDRLAAAQVPFAIGAVSLRELVASDGVFVTNAVRGVRWVREVAGLVDWPAPHPLAVVLGGEPWS